MFLGGPVVNSKKKQLLRFIKVQCQKSSCITINTTKKDNKHSVESGLNFSVLSMFQGNATLLNLVYAQAFFFHLSNIFVLIVSITRFSNLIGSH